MILIIGQTILAPIASAGVVFAEGEEDQEEQGNDDSGNGDNPDESDEKTKEVEDEKVNKEDLDKAIKQFNQDEAESYTADSFNAYAAAVSEGKNIYENNDSTQDDVNKAVDKIENAVNALKKKDLGSDSSEGDGKPTDTSGTGNDEDSTNVDTKNTPSFSGGATGGPVVLANGPYDNLQESDIESVEFKLNEQSVSSPVDVKNGDSAEFKFSLKEIVAGHNYGNGSTLTFSLPNVFSNVDVKTGIGQYGNVTSSGNEITLTFNDNVRDELSGDGIRINNVHFEISARFNKTSDGLDEQVTIPGGLTLDLNFTPLNGESVKKEQGVAKDSAGNIVTKNPDYFEWTVIVNTNLNATNGEFTDTLAPGHTFKADDKVTVTELTMKADGTYDKGTPVERDPDSYATNEITLNLDIDKAYEITYKTYPDDPGNGGWKQYSNTANYNGSSTNNTPYVEFDTGIKKTVGNAKSDLTTDWEIIVNENKRNLGNITVADEWSTTGGSTGAKQKLVGDVKVYEADGTTEVTTGFTFNQSQDEQGFNIVFNNIGTNTYKIKYTTKPTDDTYINSDMIVNNTVTRSDDINIFKDNKSVTYTKNSFMLNKTTPAIDYETKRIDWSIVANQAEETLENPLFEDRFINENMTLDDTTLIVEVDGVNQTEGNDYTLTVLDNNEGFDIKFNKNVDKQVTITYTTDYIIQNVGSNDNVYINDVTLISDNDVPNVTDSAQRSSSEKPGQADNGQKTGVYNYAEKRFEWEVELNFNYNEFTNAVFEDIIKPDTPGQTIDPDSVKVYKGTLNSDGDFIQGAEVSPTVKDVNGNTLRLELGDIKTPHKVVYESSVTDKVIPETDGKLQVTNTATLKDGTTDNASWTKTVGVNYTDKLINKTGSQVGSTAGIKWNFEFNYAQSQLENIVITDDVGKDTDGNPNQLFKEESFKVYPVTLSGTSDNPNFSAAAVGATPLDPSEYRLNVDIKNGTFELKLPDGDNAYYVEYETVYLGANVGVNDPKVKNQVEVNYHSANGTKADGSYSFNTFSYQGGANVVKVPFVVIKTDGSTGEPIEDIEFTLHHAGTDNPLITDTTNSDGIFDIGIKIAEVKYYLTENNVPVGYDNPGKIEFDLHEDNVEKDGPYKGYQVVEVENFPENYAPTCDNFTLTVKDANGDARDGVKVKYVNKVTGKEVEATDETKDGGKVSVPRENLPAGKYDVFEIKDNNEQTKLGEVDVKYDGNCEGSVQPNSCPDFTITVKDQNGEPRQNIEVTVKDGNNEVAKGTTNNDGELIIDRDDLPNAGTYDVYEGGIYLGEVEVNYNEGCEAEVDPDVSGVNTCPAFTITVNDRSDNPRENVKVVVKDSDGNLVEGLDGSGDPITEFTTNTEGQITLPYVIEKGTYTVYEVNDNGTETRINSFTVATECEAEVKPRSSGGGGGWTPPPTDPEDPKTCDDFTVTIKEDGTPVTSGKYTFTSEDGKTEVEGSVDSNGKIVIDRDNLPEGKYTVTNEDGEEVGTITVTYEEGQCNDEINITQAPVCDEYTVTVKEDGTPVESGEYTFTSEDSETKVTETVDSNGKIVFDRDELPAGKYTVEDEEGRTSSITVEYTEDSCGTEVNFVTEEDPEDPEDPDKPGEEDPEDPEDPNKPGEPGTEDPNEEDDGTTKGDGDSKDPSDKDEGKTKGDGAGTKGDGTGTKGDSDKTGLVVSGQTDGTDQGDGTKLPKTATNIYNLVFIGLALVVLGFILVYRRRTV